MCLRVSFQVIRRLSCARSRIPLWLLHVVHHLVIALGAAAIQLMSNGDISGAEAAKIASARITKDRNVPYMKIIKDIISEGPEFQEVEIPFVT